MLPMLNEDVVFLILQATREVSSPGDFISVMQTCRLFAHFGEVLQLRSVLIGDGKQIERFSAYIRARSWRPELIRHLELYIRPKELYAEETQASRAAWAAVGSYAEEQTCTTQALVDLLALTTGINRLQLCCYVTKDDGDPPLPEMLKEPLRKLGDLEDLTLDLGMAVFYQLSDALPPGLRRLHVELYTADAESCFRRDIKARRPALAHAPSSSSAQPFCTARQICVTRSKASLVDESSAMLELWSTLPPLIPIQDDTEIGMS